MYNTRCLWNFKMSTMKKSSSESVKYNDTVRSFILLLITKTYWIHILSHFNKLTLNITFTVLKF